MTIDQERVIKRAVRIVERGGTYVEAAREIGVSDWYLRRQPEVRAARARGNPDVFSLNRKTETVSCEIKDPRRDIRLVEQVLERLLGNDYILSPVDARRLRRVLNRASRILER